MEEVAFFGLLVVAYTLLVVFACGRQGRDEYEDAQVVPESLESEDRSPPTMGPMPKDMMANFLSWSLCAARDACVSQRRG